MERDVRRVPFGSTADRFSLIRTEQAASGAGRVLQAFEE
jgi:hypothetical protein